jgi:GNAT superfamily N-acetyltransferase
VAHVRYGSAVDAEAISRVRHDAWRAAYAGIIMAEIIDRATGVRDTERERALFVSRPWRRTLVAESVPGPPAAAGPPSVPGPPVPAPPATGPPAAAAPPSVPTPAAPLAPAAGPSVPAPATGIIGYASFGPERDVDGSPLPERTDRDGSPRPRCAELYALYVTPAWWSTGTGRDLMCRVLEETRTGGYQRIVLWVLEQNSRARRFYERAGFRLDGRSFVPDWLGGVTEVCYARDLDGP